MLWISQEVVAASGITQMGEAQRIIEDVFRLQMQGKTRAAQEVPLKLQADASEEAFYSLPAYVGGQYGVAGIKWTTHHPGNTKAGRPHIYTVLLLNDPRTGEPLAAIEGSVISAMRTGAVTATALKYAASSQAQVLLCCGAGFQARQQLCAACSALPRLRQVYIWGRTCSKAEALARELAAVYGRCRFTSVTNPHPYACKAEVVVSATSAAAPYLEAADFQSGCLYCHIGLNDISEAGLLSFDNIIYDAYEEGLPHSGQSLFRACRQGHVPKEKLFASLGELVTGKCSIRQCSGQRLMFDAFGLVIFDLALGAVVYNYARAQGLGQKLSLWEKPLWRY